MTKRFRVPRTIKIEGNTWRIRRVPMEDCFGVTDLIAKEIWIHKPLSAEQAKSTLLHEILHVVVAQAGLVELFKEEMVEEGEEIVVRNVETALFPIMRFFFEK